MEEVKVRFEVGKFEDQTLLCESEFITKFNTSVKQAASGQTKTLSKEQHKEFLGL